MFLHFNPLLPSQQVSQKRLKTKVFSPLFFDIFFAMAEGLDQRISKYGVLGATKKNFSLLRGVQPTSTPAYFFLPGHFLPKKTLGWCAGWFHHSEEVEIFFGSSHDPIF